MAVGSQHGGGYHLRGNSGEARGGGRLAQEIPAGITRIGFHKSSYLSKTACSVALRDWPSRKAVFMAKNGFGPAVEASGARTSQAAARVAVQTKFKVLMSVRWLRFTCKYSAILPLL